MERRRERFVGLCNQAKNGFNYALQDCKASKDSKRLLTCNSFQIQSYDSHSTFIFFYFSFFFSIDIYHLKARVGPTYLYGIWKYMDDRDNKQTCLHFLPNTKVLYIHFSFETWIELKIQGTSCAATSSQMTQMLKKKQKVPAERQKEKKFQLK